MVKETNASINRGIAFTIKVDFNRNIGFLGLASDFCGPQFLLLK